MAGKQVPGPRVGTTLMSASQAMDNSAVSYMEAMEEFLCAAGLDQSQCSGPQSAPVSQTGKMTSQINMDRMAETESKTMELIRGLATAELTMNKLVVMLNHLVQHHANLRFDANRLLQLTQDVYGRWATASKEPETSAVGQNCLNSLTKGPCPCMLVCGTPAPPTPGEFFFMLGISWGSSS